MDAQTNILMSILEEKEELDKTCYLFMIYSSSRSFILTSYITRTAELTSSHMQFCNFCQVLVSSWQNIDHSYKYYSQGLDAVGLSWQHQALCGTISL